METNVNYNFNHYLSYLGFTPKLEECFVLNPRNYIGSTISIKETNPIRAKIISIEDNIFKVKIGSHVVSYLKDNIKSVEEYEELVYVCENIKNNLNIVFDDYEFIISKDRITVIIYYPELLITNTEDDEHIIKDLYVKIEMNILKDKISINQAIYGMRGSASESEISSGYLHSHLSTCYNDPQFRPFCLGSGENTIYGAIARHNNITGMEESLVSLGAFAFSLDSFVKWESLEGGPYITISNINKIGERSIGIKDSVSVDMDSLYEYVIKNLNDIDYELIPCADDPYFLIPSIDFNYLEDVVYTILKDKSDFSGMFCNKGIDGSYTTGRIDTSSLNPIFYNTILTYKGKEIKFKINKEDRETKETIMPYITNKIKLKLEEKLLNFLQNEKIFCQ